MILKKKERKIIKRDKTERNKNSAQTMKKRKQYKLIFRKGKKENDEKERIKKRRL